MYIEVAKETVVYKNISILQTFNCILSLNCREKNKYLSLSQLRVTRQKHLKKNNTKTYATSYAKVLLSNSHLSHSRCYHILIPL